jgi:hypothetical protein
MSKTKAISLFSIAIILVSLNVRIVDGNNFNLEAGDEFKWKQDKDYRYVYKYGDYYTQVFQDREQFNIKRSYSIIEVDELSKTYYYDHYIDDEREARRSKSYDGSHFYDHYANFIDFFKFTPNLGSETFVYFGIDIDFLLIGFSYIIEVEWGEFNEHFKMLLDPSNYLGYNLTLGDFLDNTTYKIMGENSIESALQKFKPKTRHWTIEIDFKDVLIWEDDYGSYKYNEAWLYFELQYSERGILEKLVYSRVLINPLSDFRWYTNIHHSTVIRNNLSAAELTGIIYGSLVATVFVSVLIIRSKTVSKSDEKKIKVKKEPITTTTGVIYLEDVKEVIGDKFCGICKLEIRDDQAIRQCLYCKTIFHEEHILSWLDSNFDCPVCDRRIK